MFLFIFFSPPNETKNDPITNIKENKTDKKMNSEADNIRFLAELTEEQYRLTHGGEVQKNPLTPLALVYREEKIDPGGLGGDFFIGNDKIGKNLLLLFNDIFRFSSFIFWKGKNTFLDAKLTS